MSGSSYPSMTSLAFAFRVHPSAALAIGPTSFHMSTHLARRIFFSGIWLLRTFWLFRLTIDLVLCPWLLETVLVLPGSGLRLPPQLSVFWLKTGKLLCSWMVASMSSWAKKTSKAPPWLFSTCNTSTSGEYSPVFSISIMENGHSSPRLRFATCCHFYSRYLDVTRDPVGLHCQLRTFLHLRRVCLPGSRSTCLVKCFISWLLVYTNELILLD